MKNGTMDLENKTYVIINAFNVISFYITRLKNDIGNNSTSEGAIYESEWVKINLNWVILVFSFYVCCC